MRHVMRCPAEYYDVLNDKVVKFNVISSMVLCKLNEGESFYVYYNDNNDIYLNHLSLFDVMGFACKLRYNKSMNEFELDLDGPFMNKDNEGNEFIKLVRKWDEFVSKWNIEMCGLREKDAEYPYSIYFELSRK